MSDQQERQQLVRGCVIAFSVIICAFLWGAVLSFDLVDWPSPHTWPHPEPAQNAAGRAGAWIAYHLFLYFGSGAYAAVIGITMAIGVLAQQGRLPSLWQRIIGVALLVAVASAGAHLMTAHGPDRWVELRGGVLGYVLATWLQQSVKWLTWPILGYALFVGMIFTAEGLMMKIPRVLRERRAQASASAPARASRKTASKATRTDPNWLSRIKHVVRAGLATGLGTRAQPAVATAGRGAKRAPGQDADESSPAREVKINRRGPASADATAEEDAASAATGAKSKTAAAADAEPEEAEWDDGEWEDAAEGEWEEGEWEEDAEGEWDEEESDEVEEAEDDEAETDAEAEDVDEDEDEPVLAPEPKMIVKIARPPAKPAEAAEAIQAKPYPTELAEWECPSINLLEDPEYNFSSQQEAIVREKARVLEQTLADYKIVGQVVEIDTGPVITMFEIQVAPGVKVSQIASLANDIARSLRAPSVRVVAPIPGKSTIGIEVPNVDKEKVRIKELMTMSGPSVQKMALPLFLGKDASGGALVSDLAKMPHMLIAGTTGSGKSVCINSIIVSLLMTQRPDMVKLILVDPKMVEMSMFRDVPHLMCPIVTEMERGEKILEWATVKMDERYALLAEAGVRNIAAYNRLTTEEKEERFQPSNDDERAKIPQHLPYIVIMIDELADMMMMSAKEVELHLSRLAQKSRAVGIHIIVATQRPEAKIVTGLIKSNLPCRVAFRVASRMDSRIVLDQNGAEVLMGQGDMLYLPPGSAKLMRAQGTYLEDGELKAVLSFLKERGTPEFHPELMQLRSQELSSDGPRDELFNKAVDIVLETRRGSVSLLQRRLTVGYSRASRLIEEMAAARIVGEYKGSQAREVMISREEWEALKNQEADQLRSRALEGDDVPDMIYDDDL